MSAISTEYRAPGVYEVTKEFVGTTHGFKHLVLKPTIQILNWAKWGFGGLSETAQKTHNLFKKSNGVLGWGRFPNKLSKVKSAAKKFIEACQNDFLSSETGIKAVLLGARMTDVVSFGAGIIDLLQKEGIVLLTEMQTELIKTLGIVGSGASVINSFADAYKHCDEISAAKVSTPQYKLAWSKLIAKVMGIATSILGLIGFILGFSIAAEWVFLSLSTASLCFTIGNHFYKKLVVEPLENKQRTL
jgi:hypothetical protein